MDHRYPVERQDRQIGADPLERHVVEVLLSELEQPAFLAAFGADNGHDDERRRIVTELGGVDQRRAELAALWTRGEFASTEWHTARHVLDDTRAGLEHRLAAISQHSLDLPDPDTIRSGCDLMTLDERRALLRRFTAQVVVRPAKPGTRRFDPERVHIRWRE